MKKVLIGAAMLLALGISCRAFSAEPRVAKYVKYDAGEFVIVTSRSASQARKFVEDLAKFRLTLERALGKHATKSDFPTTIVITGASDWRAWLQPRENVAGFFQRARFANYLALNGDAPPEEALAIVFHEFTHYYLASQFSGEYPPWFNEGLAELMGYARFKQDSVVLLIPTFRLNEARDGDWIPFDRLLRVDEYDPEYQSHRLAASFYAQSWLTVHYGMVENRDFGRQIIKYINELNKLVPQEDAARASFGDLATADKLLRDYSRQNRISSGGMNLGEMPQVMLPAGSPLAEMDTLAMLAGVMLDSRLPPGRVRPLVDSLERRDPNKARAAILAARVAQADQDDAAFDQAVNRAEAALAPGDWEQRRELASVLLVSGLERGPLSTRKREDTQRDVSRAMKWFAEAISHNNQDVEALWGFGAAATELGKNLDVAEEALVAAYKRAPSSAEIALSLSNLKSRQEKPDEMIPYLEDTIRYATDLGTRRWAADTLIETRKFIAERNRIDAENKKIREDYEKTRAEYEKKYGKKKKAAK
jgi:tetratricopeptide (TPR) repeat protein